jgi:hypothetical protein
VVHYRRGAIRTTRCPPYHGFECGCVVVYGVQHTAQFALLYGTDAVGNQSKRLAEGIRVVVVGVSGGLGDFEELSCVQWILAAGTLCATLARESHSKERGRPRRLIFRAHAHIRSIGSGSAPSSQPVLPTGGGGGSLKYHQMRFYRLTLSSGATKFRVNKPSLGWSSGGVGAF